VCELYPLYTEFVRPFPEVGGVLSQLKNKGVKMGISSNVPSKFLEEHLRRFDMLRYFDAITGQDDCDEQKPSPKPILTTLSKLNIHNPKNAAYAGDMEEDMIAGKRARVYTIAVDRREAYQPIWRLKRHNPDYTIARARFGQSEAFHFKDEFFFIRGVCGFFDDVFSGEEMDCLNDGHGGMKR
jgi:phosphoglycolate phosphatase-like HAD superfamily hydrolase